MVRHTARAQEIVAVSHRGSHGDNTAIVPNFVNFIPHRSHCTFNGHEKYLMVNRERQPVPKCRCWMGPGTPTASSSKIFAFAKLRILSHRGPSGMPSSPHSGYVKGRHLSEGGGDRWE